MKRLMISCLAAGLLLAGDRGGIRPRTSAADYPAQKSASGLTLAAAIVAPDQVAKLFATDLNKGGYIVLEVAIYPDAGTDVSVLTRDFLLRNGSDPTTVRAVTGQTIAGAMQRRNTPKPRNPGDITVYPTSTIGYESGPYGRGGVYTSSGVGVGIGDPGPQGPPPPGSTVQDRHVMREELEDKGLPEGKTSQAVAGYLYFPKPASAKKDATWTLTYYTTDGQIRMVVPRPAKK